MIAPSENVAEMIRKLAFERFRKSLDQSLEKRKATDFGHLRGAKAPLYYGGAEFVSFFKPAASFASGVAWLRTGNR
jgi:hypothetical protein